MRIGPDQQPLSYDVRLPDWVQADALRLLDASRAVVNALLARLWSRLDEFWGERSGPAWKQVVAMTESPDPHGNRQFRCESETAGRILRAQAERKQVFALIRPILSDGFIRPTHDARPAGKNRKTIKEAIQRLQTMLEEDDTAFVTMQNVVEQACNYFLKHGEFPTSYEQMQGMPLLKVGLLTYAGDDGGAKGQAYRFSLDRDAGTASLLFRCPDEAGRWHWQKDPVTLALPSCVLSRLKEGVPMAPTLRELVKADGSRVAVLDVIVQVPKTSLAAWKTVQRVLGFDWGVRGLITAVVLSAPGQQLSKPLFLDTGGLDGHEARNRELAHLAANLLLLFAAVWGCSLISGESLKTLKSTGRGKGVRGRWRNWRNNTTIRSEIWHIVRYKSHLVGMRFRSERPRGTSHTCPRCGKPAHTYRSPRLHHRSDPVKWGRWLVCAHNADRDYCAAVNIARLGVAFLTQMQATGKARACSVTDATSVKPCPYMAHGAVPLFPPQTLVGRLLEAGKIYINGWKKSCTIRSSYASPLLLRLCS